MFWGAADASTIAAAGVAATLQTALSGQSTRALDEVAERLQTLAPSDREAVARTQPSDGIPWGAAFAAAARRHAQDPCSVWALLAVLTDVRPPPVRDFAQHFGDAVLLEELAAGVSAGPHVGARAMACRCLRNLARVPPLRARLEDSIAPLVAALAFESGEEGELAGAAAAALCNVACTTAGKERAVSAGAVSLLLRALRQEVAGSLPGCAERADDVAACLGVLAAGFAPGAEALFGGALGFAPLVEALRLGEGSSAVPAATALEVMRDVAMASGPEGLAAARLAADKVLVGKELPRLVASPMAEVRTSALRLCALLLELADFRASFEAAGGAAALQVAADMEPPAPPEGAAGGARRAKRETSGAQRLCDIRCEDPCCFPRGLGASPGDAPVASRAAGPPPTRRELAEGLLVELQMP